MRIGELARRTGISVRMLRYYEEQGLLQPQRLSSGYREYAESEAQIVERIAALSEAGLRLESIRAVLPCVKSNGEGFQSCEQVRPALERELARISDKIDTLVESRRILADYLRQLDL